MDLPKETPELLRRAKKAQCICHGASRNLTIAAESGCLKCCSKYIAQAGRRIYSWTALIQAAWQGHLEVMRLLIPYEVRMRDTDGRTALMNAAANGQLGAVKLLIPHEAKLQDGSGSTALMLCVQKGHLDVAELLIPYEAGIKDTNTITATMMAAQHYQLYCVGALLTSQMEQTASRIPPVMLAAYRGNVAALVALKAKWQKKYFDLTVLDFAMLGRQWRAMRMLAGSLEFREFSAQEIVREAADNRKKAAVFFSCYASSIRDIFPIICAAPSGHRSRLFALGLVERADISRCLRPFCVQDAYTVIWRLSSCADEAAVAFVLSGVKHTGFSYNGRGLLNLYGEAGRLILKCLESDALKRKHAALAYRETEENALEGRQAGWRETSAECRLNLAVLLEARCVGQDARAAGVRVVCGYSRDRRVRIRQKHASSCRFLLDSFRFMQKVVQAMLDE